jgi:hypothetical protein
MPFVSPFLRFIPEHPRYSANAMIGVRNGADYDLTKILSALHHSWPVKRNNFAGEFLQYKKIRVG